MRGGGVIKLNLFLRKEPLLLKKMKLTPIKVIGKEIQLA